MEYEETKRLAMEFATKHKIEIPKPSFSKLYHFVCSCGSFRLTDPCYPLNTWCAGNIDNVQTGIWNAGLYTVAEELDFVLVVGGLMRQQALDAEFDTLKCNLTELLQVENITNPLVGVSPFEDMKVYSRIWELHQQLLSLGLNKLFASTLPVANSIRLLSDKYRMQFDRTTFEGNLKKLINDEIHRRTSILYAVHTQYESDYRFSNENLLATFRESEVLDVCLGVDSGQAGIFDLEAFTSVARPETGKSAAHETFYDSCCDWLGSQIKTEPTMIKLNGDSLPMGVNSNSGYGDGSYRVFCVRNEIGEVIALAYDYLRDIGGELEDDE